MTKKELEKALETGEEQYNDLVDENNKLNEEIIQLQIENQKLRESDDIKLAKIIGRKYHSNDGKMDKLFLFETLTDKEQKILEENILPF